MKVRPLKQALATVQIPAVEAGPNSERLAILSQWLEQPTAHGGHALLSVLIICGGHEFKIEKLTLFVDRDVNACEPARTCPRARTGHRCRRNEVKTLWQRHTAGKASLRHWRLGWRKASAPREEEQHETEQRESQVHFRLRDVASRVFFSGYSSGESTLVPSAA